MSRERFVEAGPCRIEGRAWSGLGSITTVELSVDGGRSWDEAELGRQTSEFAWRSWWYDWTSPGPGSHELCSRATDDAGHRQPSDVRWNLKGYANNAVQRVVVMVRP